MMKQSLIDLKGSIKKEIDKFLFFPGIKDQLTSIKLFKLKPVFNMSMIKTQTKAFDSIEKSLDEMFSLNFSFENEYISKPYAFFSQKLFYKLIFLSNLYKIFIINIPQLPHFSSFDFYSLIILICPDFPKGMIKKLTIISGNFASNTFSSFNYNDNIELSLKINVHEFFCLFTIFFIYSDFFNELEKIYSNTAIVSIKELKKIKYIKQEALYEILISTNDLMKQEYLQNPINSLDDTEEIIDKKDDIKISYGLLCEKCLKNYNMLSEIFRIDDKGYEYLYLLNALNYD